MRNKQAPLLCSLCWAVHVRCCRAAPVRRQQTIHRRRQGTFPGNKKANVNLKMGTVSDKVRQMSIRSSKKKKTPERRPGGDCKLVRRAVKWRVPAPTVALETTLPAIAERRFFEVTSRHFSGFVLGGPVLAARGRTIPYIYIHIYLVTRAANFFLNILRELDVLPINSRRNAL